jgi:hypothetical protein
MLTKILTASALTVFAMSTAAHAQQSMLEADALSLAKTPLVKANQYQSLSARTFDWTLDGPITPDERLSGMAAFQQGALGHDLLTSIVSWLSTQFDLPPIYDHPRVANAPTVKLTALDYGVEVTNWQRQFAEANRAMSIPPALGRYEDSVRTIYVPNGWSGGTHEEQSILVHQMVFHLQNLAGMKFECSQDRAKLAYVAQERWLALSGHHLEASFAIDPATFLFSTECHIP